MKIENLEGWEKSYPSNIPVDGSYRKRDNVIMSRQSLKNVMKLIDDATKSLSVEESFLNDLKRSIEDTDMKNRGDRPSKTYKPSSLVCLRNMWFQLTGADTDNARSSYTGIGICNSGSDIHNRIQTAIDEMKDNGIDCEYVDVETYIKENNLDYLEIREKYQHETKLHHQKLNMNFMTDGIIKYKGKYYILEIKSEISGKWYSRQDVDLKHYDQATAYSISFKLDDVIFLYVSRDTLDMKAYLFHVKQSMKEDLIGRITECDGYAERGIMPPKPNNLPKGVCNYCTYQRHCRGEK